MATTPGPASGGRVHLTGAHEQVRREPPDPSMGRWWLWVGLAGGPIAWAIERLVIAALSPGCGSGTTGLRLFGMSPAQSDELVVTILTALLALGSGFISWRIWRRTGRAEEETVTGTIRRTSFWALGGLFLNAVFFIAILVTGGTVIALATSCR